MKIRKVATMAAAATVFALASTASPALTFSTFVSGGDLATALGNNATIGFSYAGDRFVGSVYFGTNNNQLYQTNLTGGNVQLFGSPIAGFSGEIYVSASLGLGGYGPRDVYAGSEALGTVARLAHDGSSQGVFASGLVGGVRSIAFDPFGLYGNQMIVATRAGNVYRVSNTGVATLLANVGEDTEGISFAPDVFGTIPFGTLVVASEGSGALRSITPSGIVNQFATVPSAEMLSFVPLSMTGANPLEGFYSANYPNNVVHAPASDFLGLLGDIVVTGETTHDVTRVHWDGSSFVTSSIGTFPGQPEDGIFVTAAIINPCERPNACAAPEPASAALVATALGAFIATRRRRRLV